MSTSGDRTGPSQPEKDSSAEIPPSGDTSAPEPTSGKTVKKSEKAKWSLGEIFNKLEKIEGDKPADVAKAEPQAENKDRKIATAKPLGQKPERAGIKVPDSKAEEAKRLESEENAEKKVEKEKQAVAPVVEVPQSETTAADEIAAEPQSETASTGDESKTPSPVRARYATKFHEPESDPDVEQSVLHDPLAYVVDAQSAQREKKRPAEGVSSFGVMRPTAEVRAVDLDASSSLLSTDEIFEEQKFEEQNFESASGQAEISSKEYVEDPHSPDSPANTPAEPVFEAAHEQTLEVVQPSEKPKARDLIPNIEHPRMTASGLVPLPSAQPSTQFIKAAPQTGSFEKRSVTAEQSIDKKETASRYNWRQDFFGRKGGPRKFENFVATHQIETLCASFWLMTVSWGYAVSHDEQVARYIAKIRNAFASKDYDEALATAKAGIKKYPNVADFHFYKGKVYLKAHQKHLALKEFENTLGKPTTDPEKLNFRAKLYADTQQYQKAIADYNVLLKTPAYAVAYNFANRGFCKMMVQDHAGALADFNSAVKLDPKNNSYYTSRAFAFSGLRRYKEALQDWSSLIKRDPNDINAYTERGNTHYLLQNFPAAISDLTKSISIKPSSRTYFYRGLVHRDMHDSSKAISDFTEAAKLDPRNADIYEALGYAYSATGEFADASKNYEKVIELEPGTKDSFFNIAYAHANMEMGHHVKAAKAYGEELAKKPNDRKLRELHALCAERAGDLSKAYEDYSYLITKNPTSSELNVLRGSISAKQEKYDLAEADFERALVLDGDNTQALYRRALANADQEKYDAALMDLSRILKMRPNDAMVKHAYSEISREKASHTIAMKDVPNSAQAHHAKVKLTGNALTDGYNQMGAGDTSAAIKNFSTAVKNDPSDVSARRYLAYALLDDGQYAQAASQFKALDVMNALNPEEEVKYAKACVSAGNRAQAAHVYDKRLKRFPADVETRMALAQIYSDMNARDRAKSVCEDGLMATNSPQDYKKLKQFLAILKQRWSAPTGTPAVDIGG